MRKILYCLTALMVSALLYGCKGSGAEEDVSAPNAPINNNDPRAATTVGKNPVMNTGAPFGPGALKRRR